MKYNRQISIEVPTTVYGGEFGPVAGPWIPLVALPGSPAIPEKFWAQVQDVPPSRSEAVRQGLQLARNQVRLRMRWRDDVNSAMRVTVHGEDASADVVYQIVGGPAEINGRKRELELMLERYSTAGGP